MSDLESRIRRLEDAQAIGRVLTDYGRFLDARDFRAYADLFAADGGEWVGGFGAAKGRDAIFEMMTRSIGAAGSGGMPANSFHLLSNYEIDVDGDTAIAWSRWQFVVHGEDGRPVIFFAGRYDDELVREAGAWKFQRRVVSADTQAGPPAR